MPTDSTKRFSNRVDNYVKFRPGYPDEVLAFLRKEYKLTSSSTIADIGSGTGIFTKLLLEEGYQAYAVEPNDAMRIAAENELSGYKGFKSVNGTAAATGLPAKNIDLIVCAQAFHWFNNAQTRHEFERILKDTGNVALIWNNRITNSDAFSIAYDELLKKDGLDYDKVNHQNINNIDFKAFFSNGEYHITKYPNVQIFDEAGLIGRAFSSSYVPAEGTDAGKQFSLLLKQLFEKYNEAGKVKIHYQTEIYSGKV
jgi:SAM-dependent methyltransferase